MSLPFAFEVCGIPMNRDRFERLQLTGGMAAAVLSENGELPVLMA